MDHFDIVIVGAGLSGVGAASYFKTNLRDKTVLVLEGREAMGGTWDLFRYPGIRSDSDMYTMAYRFRPWSDPKAIADGPAILNYIRDTAAEFGIDKQIRYQHRLRRASWSSDDSRWTLEVDAGSEQKIFTCSFLYLCTGYYDYDAGYTPEWPSVANFKGPIVHPQRWPDDLDYSGKRVVVIGSGATAVTLVPAMAEHASHVTMLQRSPTYIVARASQDGIANFLRRVLPSRAAYVLSRWKNVLYHMFFYTLSRKRPQLMKRIIGKGVERELGNEYDAKHFTPPYNPWDQRMCLVPDADLFQALREGKASIVTDEIEAFTETGLKLKSGESLDADVIVTATGLVLKIMSGLELVVDGAKVELSDKIAYKGMMYSDIPNLAQAFGYTNASWTLKCDLTTEYVARLIKHMDQHGQTSCAPRFNDPTVQREAVLDFTSGYIQRALHTLPSQGSKPPWRLHQNYAKDIVMLRYGRVDDGVIEFK